MSKQYWLMKSEPDAYAWDQLVKDGTGIWDGVRNHSAKLNMKAMKVGDEALFYHSNIGKEAVGICEVIAEAHPDSTSDDPKWECVDVRAVRKLPRPVSLEEAKAEPRLKDMVLVTNSRLSVQPVTPGEWAVILDMAGA